MKNGDRLSGEILKFDGKNLTVKSEFAGTVTIPWDAVTGVSSGVPLNVGLKDGQVIVGPVATADDKFRISTQAAGPVAVAKESIEFIRSKEEQAAYETEIDRYRNPRIIDLWTGGVDLGFSTSQGNVNTSAINVSANANRETSRDKINVHLTSIYANSDASGMSITTANAMRGGIGYNLNVNSKLFAFGSVDLEFDEFQNLDLRFAPAGGFGYHAWKTARTAFDLQGGASLNREFFATGLERTSGEVLLGQEFNFKMTEKTSFREKFVIFPNVTDTGSYRMNFDASANTALLGWLGWQVALSDRFLSNPVPGRQKNDILLTTGFRITFAK